MIDSLRNYEKKLRLAELEKKYADFKEEAYENMSTHDHVQTLFELDELRQLREEVRAGTLQPMSQMTLQSPQMSTMTNAFNENSLNNTQFQSQPQSQMQLQPQVQAQPQTNWWDNFGLISTAQAAEVVPTKNNDVDLDLINRMYETIKSNEDFKDFPYYDIYWNPTVGPGLNISNPKLANSYDWRDKDDMSKPATQQQKDSCWIELAKKKSEIIQENPDFENEHNFKAEHFKKACDIRVSDEYMRRKYIEHMKDDLKNIRDLIPPFDSLDESTKYVIMDMMYSLGKGKFAKFRRFIEAAKKNDIEGMISECDRRGVKARRNNWAKNTLSKGLKR